MGLAYASAHKPLHTRRQRLGYLAATVTVLIWAGFALSIRGIGQSPLLPADVALLRFGVPALLLLPFLPSRLGQLRRLNSTAAAFILIGAGLPFFFLATLGGLRSSSAHVGALIAGTVPVSVAVLGLLLLGHRIGKRTLPALAMIVLGVVALTWAAPAGDRGNLQQGVLLLLCASLLWAVYTLGLRTAALDPIACALLLSIPSFLVLALLCATGLMQTTLLAQPLQEIAPFAVIQGLGVGVIASLAYAFAIQSIGAQQTAIFGSLAPALTTALAVPLFGETITPTLGLGVSAITCGVLLNAMMTPKGR
ncbi:DMT family transporter [Microbulbifer sp. S227A]|uniref:DMT family transporter n=1 Tax=Microbulbifer sp. S227A TaxID=3415131 RepID=UPI003C7EC6EB